jgi:alanine racemase
VNHRPTVAVIDLDAVRHNVRVLKPPGAELMAVVKANGYGHGAVPVARAAIDAGATWLGVAMVEEGIELRDAGLQAPILVLSEFPPGSEKEALAARLTPTLYTEGGLRRVTEAASATGGRVGVHVKVDTGMHRVGLFPKEAPGFVRDVLESGLDLEGLWTHFAKAEELSDPFTARQLALLLEVAERVRAAGGRPRYLHAANSAAIITRTETHLDLVRLGVAMYGLSPDPALDDPVSELRPAMGWRSAISLVKRLPAGEALSYGHRFRLDREATVATVPVGYADGYARAMGDHAQVLIRGLRHPVAGTVTMDQILVDCGDEPVEAGDQVVLIGPQGQDRVTAEETAAWRGTIAYEVVCGVSERVPRAYVEGGTA